MPVVTVRNVDIEAGRATDGGGGGAFYLHNDSGLI
jgi:hypothetical protein